MLTLIYSALKWDKNAAQKTSFLFIYFLSIITAFCIFHYTNPPEVNLFSDDALSYINFNATRTVGYPAFLWLVKLITGGFELIPFIQLAIFSLCIFITAIFFVRFTNSFLLGLVLIVCMFSLREIIKFCFEIFTESLAVSFLLLFSVSVMAFIKTNSRRSLFAMGVLLGLTILIRPSSYAFLAALGCLLVFYHHLWKKILTYTVPSLLGCLLIGAMTNYSYHGYFSTQSFLGHNLYGKVAFTVKKDMTAGNALEDKMIKKMAAVMEPLQNTLKPIESWRLYYILAAPIYDKLRYPILQKFSEDLRGEIGALKDLDSFYKTVSLEVIKQNPLGYMEDVIINYSALWFLGDLNVEAERKELVKLFDHVRSMPEFQEIGMDYSFYKLRQHPDNFIYLVRMFLYGAFILSLFFIVWTGYSLMIGHKLKDLLIYGFFCATSIHASYLSIAMVQAGLPRYAMAMWPYMFMMVLSGVGFGLSYMLNKLENTKKADI